VEVGSHSTGANPGTKQREIFGWATLTVSQASTRRRLVKNMLLTFSQVGSRNAYIWLHLRARSIAWNTKKSQKSDYVSLTKNC
jgi:hypothetical protein